MIPSVNHLPLLSTDMFNLINAATNRLKKINNAASRISILKDIERFSYHFIMTIS